jgi:hypothetical protein
VACGDDFAEFALTHRGVRAQQMMIDDDEIGFRGTLAHFRDEAILVAGTLGADAVLAAGRDVFPER